MSRSNIYPFDNITNYNISDSNKIEISGNKAVLKLEQSDVDFIEDFDNDIGFTYDNTKSEFTGGQVQQKDQRPVNSIVAANFNSDLNANWGTDGFVSLTANLNGTPVLFGGKVDCIGSNGLYYEDSLIGALSGDFVSKFKYTPHYTGGPATNVNIFTLSRVSGTTDVIAIFNSPSGNNLRVTANGLSASAFDVWSPVAEQEYVFEVICISNQISLFVDGVQIGSSKTITPGQGTISNRAWLGAQSSVYNTANGAFDDFILYSTASQNPVYSFPDTIYIENNVILPEMEHTGPGTIKLFNSFSTVEGGSPRYTIQIGRSGNYLYWNGASWVVSDETYDQSNDVTTFNANVGSLLVDGEIYGQFQIHFTNSNTQSSVSQLTANLNIDIGWYQDNPWIEPTQAISGIEALEGFDSLPVDSLDFAYALYKGSQLYYHDSVDWVVSDGITQFNTILEIKTNKATFTTTAIEFNFRAFLKSNGLTNPGLDQITVTYDFAAIQIPLGMCLVHGWSLNPDNTPNTDVIVVRLIPGGNETLGNNQLSSKNIYISPRPNGYWEKEFANTEDMEQGSYYRWLYQGRTTKREVAKQSEQEFDTMVIIQ